MLVKRSIRDYWVELADGLRNGIIAANLGQKCSSIGMLICDDRRRPSNALS
jgi:hypothetical protein